MEQEQIYPILFHSQYDMIYHNQHNLKNQVFYRLKLKCMGLFDVLLFKFF